MMMLNKAMAGRIHTLKYEIEELWKTLCIFRLPFFDFHGSVIYVITESIKPCLPSYLQLLN